MTTATRNPAAAKLESLARCKKIERFQAGDEETLCASCMVAIVQGPGGWRHDPAEINRLRNAANQGSWPK